ncbi:TolC family outer membrane protein [Polymorphum gilvum]|uniref:Type I secretion outer membrane protein, TolC n=1 Tax=Polymorphum gilvum (strain LMG 25793 / CGMCC 1.9160 / SL003B-26A1) TaxID=991905 RepID=F2IXE6_POLGS|nr:TolC family outer membrane protein [Polymorphum gilvum]ADZ70464.1 Type I secretion outer membrane protein, TolC [Polymorphum gilvum SL003B-26A1]
MLFRVSLTAAFTGLAVLSATSLATAETITEALALAYANNPTLNAARAQLRGVDENVPQALSGWRPTVTAGAGVGGIRSSAAGRETYRNNASISLSVQQALFRGFRTVNSTRQAEAIVRAQRESLNATEQDVLLSAAQAYVDVIRDTALVSLQRSDLEFLGEQVRAARDRFEVGEGTRTDVSQAEARYAEAQANLNSAIANLTSSRAVYRQIVGVEARNLSASTAISRFVPKSMDEAMRIGDQMQPLIRQAQHLVDAATFSVKTIEGELLPTVSLEGSIERQWNPSSSVSTSNSASVFGRVSIPIYQGGAVHSRVRQAKEELGQAQIQLDVVRDRIRANVISAWGQYQAAEASISAAQAAVSAQQLALEGVIEEQRVGQRTTLDVLDAQRELVNQRVNLVTAQRNRIVGGYQLVSAIGRLDAEFLGLPVARYEPTQHYEKVRDKWFGLRTPDGR